MKDLSKKLRTAGLSLHSLELVINTGETLSIGDPGTRYPVYSITKSLTSAAFLLAWDHGIVSPEMPLAAFIPRDDLPETFKTLSFERFLTMTAGHYPFRPQERSWLDFILSLDTDYTDRGYHYSNIPAYLVSLALENALGRPLMPYLTEHILAPLGIPEPPFQTCPEGHFYGATGLELSAHELTLLAQLFLNKGTLNGTQLISERAVTAATTPHVPTGSGDSYGYFFRVSQDHFAMAGKWGQRVLVFPEKGLTLAYLSYTPERSDDLADLMTSWAREL